jgi:hypothetical protein
MPNASPSPSPASSSSSLILEDTNELYKALDDAGMKVKGHPTVM